MAAVSGVLPGSGVGGFFAQPPLWVKVAMAITCVVVVGGYFVAKQCWANDVTPLSVPGGSAEEIFQKILDDEKASPIWYMTDAPIFESEGAMYHIYHSHKAKIIVNELEIENNPTAKDLIKNAVEKSQASIVINLCRPSDTPDSNYLIAASVSKSIHQISLSHLSGESPLDIKKFFRSNDLLDAARLVISAFEKGKTVFIHAVDASDSACFMSIVELMRYKIIHKSQTVATLRMQMISIITGLNQMFTSYHPTLPQLKLLLSPLFLNQI
jgi:hypothetical protein